MALRSIDLDALVSDAGEVTLGGVAHVVKPLDGAAYKILLRIRAGGLSSDESFDALYEIAGRCVPTIADITALSIRQVSAIVEMAGQHITEVEKLPKSSRPHVGPQRSENGTEE